MNRLRGTRVVLPGVLLGAVTLAVVLASGSTSVTAAGRFAGCPSFAGKVIPSSRPGARATLVPTGPRRVLLCRYDGPFGGTGIRSADRFRLVARRVIVDPRRVTGLGAELNRLPTIDTSGCTRGSGSAIVAVFGYGSGPQDSVKVDTTGCTIASNGYVVRSAGLNGAPAVGGLEALVHATPSGAGRHHGAREATIRGYVQLCGGPAPGRCFIGSVGECAPAEGCSRSDRVVVIDTHGDQVAQEKLLRAHSRFRLRVRAGDYAVELLADGGRVHDLLLQTHGAIARTGRAATIIFNFDVP